MSDKPETTNPCVLHDQSCRRRYIVALGVLFVGLVLSAALFAVLRSNEYGFARRQFEQSSQDHILALRRTLETDSLVVKSLRSFYLGSEEVTGKEFSSFAVSLIENHPGILAV